MLNNKTIAVVVPAYNEAGQIGRVIETMPDFVDRIVVVNDKSSDDTAKVTEKYITSAWNDTDLEIVPPEHWEEVDVFSAAEQLVREKNQAEIRLFPPSEVVNNAPAKDRIILINLLRNSGVGAAIARGYKWCKDHDIDCTAVMAGDGQMDPSELASICRPVLEEGIDYVKGNRLRHASASDIIPKTRFFGNSVLSILTKIASGYWTVSDTQTGYTAISKNALHSIELHKIFPRYGMPNDMLVKLNMAYCTLREVTIKPVYNVGEKSKLKVFKVILPISVLLVKSFFRRLWVKYFFKDFHPLFLLYNLGFLLLIFSLPFLVSLVSNALVRGQITPGQNVMFFIFLTITGFQSLFFAMWMDIQDNDKLLK
ncbi:MAG: glycosyltransferase family 2 protein [Bacteroidales bacterium]|nr:glycosyltransferase family 2 protein [Bacteroidales bacterium]